MRGQKMMSIGVPRLLALGLGMAWITGMFVVLYLPLAYRQLEILRHETKVVEGRMVSFEPSNHATATIEYQVAGILYHQGISGLSQADLGKAVAVHYDPAHPSISYCGRRPDVIGHLVGIVVIVSLGFMGVLYGAYGKFWSKARRASLLTFRSHQSTPPPLR